MWSISNPTKIYVTSTASIIKIHGNVRYVTDSSDNINYQLFAKINGSIFYGMPYQQQMSNAGNYAHTLNCSSGNITVSGGDYVELYTQQNTAGSLNTDYTLFPEATWFAVEIIE